MNRFLTTFAKGKGAGYRSRMKRATDFYLKPVGFSEADGTLGAPKGMDNCLPLPVHRDRANRIVTSLWTLPFWARVYFLFTNRLWVRVYGSGETQPPFSLGVSKALGYELVETVFDNNEDEESIPVGIIVWDPATLTETCHGVCNARKTKPRKPSLRERIRYALLPKLPEDSKG